MLRSTWAAYERLLASHPVPTQMATSFSLWGIGDLIAQRIEHYERRHYGGANSSSTSISDAIESTESAACTLHIEASAGSQQQLHHHLHQPQQYKALQQQQLQDRLSSSGAASSSSNGSGSSTTSFIVDQQRMLLTAGFGAAFVGPVGHYWYLGIEKLCRKLYPTGGVRFLASKVVLDSAIMGSLYVAAFFAFGSIVLEGRGLRGFLDKMKVDFLPTYAAELAVWPVVQGLNFSQVPVRHQLLVVNTFSLLDAAFISWVGHQEAWFDKIMQRLGGPARQTEQQKSS